MARDYELTKAKLHSKDQYWWNTKEPHNEIWKILNFLNKNQSYLRDRNLLHMRLYGNMDIGGLSYKDYSRDNSTKPQNKIKLNICKSVVDTVVAKLTKDTPRVMFLTDGGNHTMQMKAKKLTRYVEGVFYELGMQEKFEGLVRDGGVFDNGYLHFYVSGGKLNCERVFPNEILVDEAEAFHGNPKSLYRHKPVARSVVLDKWGKDPKVRNAILAAKQLTPSSKNLRQADMINIAEAWHLPDADGKNGKHVICLENKTLFEEKYELERFPFLTYRFGERLAGWYGQGVVEILVGIQIEINKILRIIQAALKFSVPKVFIQAGSKVAGWSNMIMGQVKYTGVKPTVEKSNTVSSELFQQLENLYNKAFEVVGVSQLSSQSKKPSGLDSRVALREYMDIESDRFVTQAKAYQRTALDAAWLIINLSKKAAKDDPNFQVKYERKGRGLEFIKWKDVDIEENHYQMKMYPTNMLPRTPSGRMAYVQEMIQSGFIPPEDGAQLLDYPDIESVTNLRYAHNNLMKRTLEDILEDGTFHTPEPFEAPYLERATKFMNDAYIKARHDSVPEEKLELIRKWIKAANKIMNPEPVAPPMAPEGSLPPEDALAPQAVAEAPPVSELIPNAPNQ